MDTSIKTERYFMGPNLSFSDRQIRLVIGASMIAGVLAIAPETMGLWSIMLLASIPFITMSIIGWDPLYAAMGKSTYIEGEEDIQQRSWSCPNVGAVDRVARLGIGSALLLSLLTMTTMQVELVVTLLAIPLILTAITAWDPLYATLGINSFASHVDVEVAEPDANEETLAACYIFPQKHTTTEHYPRAA